MPPADDFQSYLKAAAPGLANTGGRCPSGADLMDHYQGALDAAAREQMESHLTRCGACRQKLVDLRDFCEPARPGETAPNTEAEWKRLASRIEGASTPVTVPGRSWRLMAAMAACLVLSAALSAQWAQQRAHEKRMAQLEQENVHLRRQYDARVQELASLKQPRLNAGVYDVFPESVLTRSAGSAAATPIDAIEGAPLVLMLSGQPVAALPDYQIEILDAGDKVIWKAQGLRRTKMGSFVITLPAGFLADGIYRLQLSGKTPRGYEKVTAYSIAVKARR